MLNFTSSLMTTTPLPAKTCTSIDNSAVHPRAVLDGDRFPSSCKKSGHWCSFIFLDPEEIRPLWRKGRKCLVGCRDNNYSPFVQQKFVFKENELWDFSGHAHPKIPKAAVSTERSWLSASYRRAGSNAAGHRDEPNL